MPVCLSHGTADELLRSLAFEGVELEPASASVLQDCDMGVDAAAGLLGRLPIARERQIDVLVGSEGNCHDSRAIVCHKWTSHVPDGAILKVDDGIYVSSPSFCLVQRASELHVVNLCQMLGGYLGSENKTVLLASGASKKKVREPLVGEEGLSRFLESMRGAKNVGAVREAMKWTCAHAASPRETDLQLVLTLPYRYGGYSLTPPIMNYEVPLDEKERRLCDRRCCRIDLYWHEKMFGLEYQGEHHSKQLGADCARHYALHSKGIDLWYAADEQLSHAEQMRYLAEEVARRVGRRRGAGKRPEIERLSVLLEVINHMRHPAKNAKW